MVRGVMPIEEFQEDCYHGNIGYLNRVILAILNHHVAQMHPTKFWFNLKYGSGVSFELFHDGFYSSHHC